MALVGVGVMAVITALSYFFLLFVGRGTSSASQLSPEDVFLSALGGLFTVILVAIALRYVYYYWCWFISRRDFGNPRHVDVAALTARELPYLKFHVTTRGGALPVVERSLRILEDACRKHPWLAERSSAEVITERPAEVDHLNTAFAGSPLSVAAVCLPAEYVTANGTGLKARALQYMIELRRTGFNAKPGRTFIVHLDEETVMTEPHLLILLDYLSRDPKPISQGPILYPLEWEQTPWICRAIESTRPFGCSECARVMNNPPPPHLHGSNLVVDEAIENQVEWDFGTLDGQPFIAEDLLFGLRAYSMLGAEAFGWHGATAIEQPPLSLYWAVQQRLRWVTGALQGLRAMRVKPEFSGMSRFHKWKLSLSVYSRIATYSLGFPVGLTGLVFLFHPVSESPSLSSPLFLLRIFLLMSAVAWILSYQIGMHRNLRYQEMPGWRRVQHHVVMLVLTPIVGLCETSGPYVALVRWMLGARTVVWTPTPKLSDRPVHPPVAAEADSHVSLPPASIPAWLRPVATLAAAVRPRGSRFVIAGRALTATGVALALFLGYEFGGTTLAYDRSQQTLLAEFKQHVVVPAGTTQPEGTPVALLSVPRLVSNLVVVQGSSPAELENGPGHFVGSPMPGEFGNVLIMGRRTTYGGPFRDLDRLASGDMITVTTSSGTFTYKVDSVARTGAGEAAPLDGTLDSRLTLVTSDPVYMPSGRLVVVAKLTGSPLDLPRLASAPSAGATLGLAGDWRAASIGLLWAALLLGTIWATLHHGRRWPATVRNLLATPVLLLLALLVCSSVDRILPGMT